jgi:phosphate-selective porin OprO/OprP
MEPLRSPGMRCWLVAACALAAWPAYGQTPGALAPLPPVGMAAGDALLIAGDPPTITGDGESIEMILARLDRLEAENAALQTRLDEVAGSNTGAGTAAPSGVQSALYEGAAGEGAASDVEQCVCNDPSCPYCNAARNYAGGRNGGGDEYPTLSWGGFLQFDTGWVSQDAANVAAVGNINAQTGLRRVRLRAGGRVHRDISYVVDLDFAASGHPSFRDVKFTAHNRPIIQNLSIGYFQQPFGLDAMTSGRDLVLMERQLPFAFAPFRQPGARAYGTSFDNRVTWSYAGFAYPTDSFGVSEGDNGGWAYASRLTGLVYDNPDARALLHVGGSYCFEDPGNDIVSYSIQPGFFVTDPSSDATSGNVPVFVDTGDIATQNVNLYGVETVGLWGPLSFQAEAVSSLVNPDFGPQLGFGAASAKLGYVLTGESHKYHRRRGVLGGVTPTVETTSFFDPGAGAWEVTAAWAWIDLEDESVQGGEMQTAIVGLNRYMNSFTKLQLNVIRALLDDPGTGESAATVVALRAQAEF